MVSPVISISPLSTLRKALSLMIQRKLKRVLELRDNKRTGLLTMDEMINDVMAMVE
ncbi:hypothetical protein [Rheinheimera fenheensis]|uniref:hypothetical protein n=1 Tax=Rheinheimera fenheensis TaxID=3152295 RepID=UPI003260683B